MAVIGSYSGSRDNNLNLIRMLAALGVLVSHAWPLTMGEGVAEPLSEWTGRSLGTLCVYVFFAISGYLIAASFARSATVTEFVFARVLRLMPGLAVSLVLVALVLGSATTTLPMRDYLSHHETWTFLARNLALVSPQYTLPGVFETNPYPTVEGSIWTLFYEVACYAGILGIGLAGLLGRPFVVLAGAVALAVLCCAVEADALVLHPKAEALVRLALPFAVGTVFFAFRDRIAMHWAIMVGLLAAAAVSRATVVYPAVLSVAIAYAVFWLAYVPGGYLRQYNRLGDYSYGIYIYAFPIQGLAVLMIGPMTPATNIAASLPAVVLLSVASWHLVERPSLAARHAVVDRVTGIWAGMAKRRARG